MKSLSAWRESWQPSLKQDLPAGFVVFLVALPLCLGIALASGAPLMSGIIAGVVSGLMVSRISGSQLSVSGPTASLIVIVSAGSQAVGGFEAFCAATIMMGVFQLGFGLLKMGFIANVFPNAVIKGMLAAIGLIIVLKQIPHGLGRDVDFEGDLGFLEGADQNTFTDIVTAILSATPGPIVICVVALLIILSWERFMRPRFRFAAFLPGPLVAVGVSVILNQVFLVFFPSLAITVPSHLVQLPTFDSLSGFFSQFRPPALTAFTHKRIYSIAFAMAIIGSIESLLSVESSDRLDPLRRISPTNRELMAQGAGNVVSGALGGLPITSAIVRSSANAYAGAVSWRASFFHGALMLLSVMFVPKALNLMPLSALAAVLFMVGYKLSNVSLFRSQYKAGFDQFLPFMITLIAILFSDLLRGVLLGLGAGVLVVMWGNHYSAITYVSEGKNYLIKFTKDVSFINKMKLKQLLASLPSGIQVLIDGSRVRFIDHDITEIVSEFETTAGYRGIKVELKGLEGKHYPNKLGSFFGALKK